MGLIGGLDKLKEPLVTRKIIKADIVIRLELLESIQQIKTILDTPDLPWATVIMPVNSPFMPGNIAGGDPQLVPGCWVIGFYLDNDRQTPIIMGSIGQFQEQHQQLPMQILMIHHLRQVYGLVNILQTQLQMDWKEKMEKLKNRWWTIRWNYRW